jgi:hypothetical protein
MRCSGFWVLGSVLLLGCGGSDGGGLGGAGGGTGSACVTTADCKTGVCEQSTGTCVACLVRSDCAGDARCIHQRCVENTPCGNSLDCTQAPAGPICDPSSLRCEACVMPADCDGTADCLEHRCVQYTACANSLDCVAPQVCDPARGRCEECVTSLDCPNSQQTCVGRKCTTLVSCVSDNQCTPLGQLCNKQLGVCVDV